MLIRFALIVTPKIFLTTETLNISEMKQIYMHGASSAVD